MGYEDTSFDTNYLYEPPSYVDPTVERIVNADTTYDPIYDENTHLIADTPGGGEIYWDPNAADGQGGAVYRDGDGNLYDLPEYGDTVPDGSSSTSGGLDEFMKFINGNLGGVLGNNTVGGALGVIGGSYLQNRANQQSIQQQQKFAEDWFNKNREAELADMERMGANKHLDMTLPAPRQQNDMRGINFSTAGERPGGLSFFTDVKRGY